MEDEQTGFFSKKKVIVSLEITILLLALPLIVFLVQKQQVYKSKAAIQSVAFTGSGVTQSSSQFYTSTLSGIKVRLISPIIAPTQAPNVNPVGWHDSSDCSLSRGWTCDANDYNANLAVHFYANGPAGSGTFIGSTTANVFRQDLVNANVCGGTGNHGFSFTMPPQINDGVVHTIYAHAINIPSPAENPLLLGTPKTITCNTKPVIPTVTVNKSCIATPNDPSTITISWTNPAGVTAVRAVDISQDNFATFYNRGAEATTTSVYAPGGFTNYYNGSSWNWGGAQLVLKPGVSYQVRLWNQQYPLTPARFTTPGDCLAPTPTPTPTPTPFTPTPTPSSTPTRTKFVLYFGSTPIDQRVALEQKYGMAWQNHAGLGSGVTLGAARAAGIIGQDYWPGYSVYLGDPNVVKNTDLQPYAQPQELVGHPDRFVLYWGSTLVDQRRAIEQQVGSRGYQFSFVNHAGCPDGLQDCINRGLISSTYWPGYSVYQGDVRALQDPGFAPYTKPPELNVQGVSTVYAASYYTTSFKMSKNLLDLENAPAQPYDSEPKLVDFTFSSTTPGTTETVFVQFLGAGGEKVNAQATITYQPISNVYSEFIKQPVSYWQTQQLPSGTFNDVLDQAISPDNHYGHSHLGASFIWAGLRQNDISLIQKGIKAISYYIDTYNTAFVGQPAANHHQPFNQFAVAHAYNLLKTQPTSIFPTTDRSKWETYLKNAVKMENPPWSQSEYLANWQLVEAAAAKEILMTGLTNPTGSSQTFLKDTNYWTNFFDHTFMETQVPAKLTGLGLGGDPGVWPTAYHTFATAWVARYLELYPQSTLIKDYFLRMVDTTLNLMGPDGDIGYFGRSNEESFTLASMAYYFEVAARLNTTKAGQYKAAAGKAMERLRTTHGLSTEGYIYIVPKLKLPNEFNRSALDGYAHLSVYNGLTLLLLTMASEAATTTTPSTIPAETNFAYLEQGGPRFAALRYGNIWMLVSGGSFNSIVTDVRYDFGLIRAKKLVLGRWVDILPTRPDSVSFKYTLAPRGFYDGGAFVLQGDNITVSGNAISINAKLINRTTLSDTGLTTTITYQTDGIGVQIIVPPYNSRVANFYTSSLFSRLPDHQIIGSDAVLTDGVRKLSITNTQVLNAATNKDPQKFYDSDLGTVYWDRLEVPNRGQTTTIKLDYIGN